MTFTEQLLMMPKQLTHYQIHHAVPEFGNLYNTTSFVTRTSHDKNNKPVPRLSLHTYKQNISRCSLVNAYIFKTLYNIHNIQWLSCSANVLPHLYALAILL